MDKIKFDLKNAPISEHIALLKKASGDRLKCGDCSECYANQENYKGELSEQGSCNNVIAKLTQILAEKLEKQENAKLSKTCGKCEQCKNVNREYFEKSGYLFCSYWHNFTVDKGFCYAFESKEPIETCG